MSEHTIVVGVDGSDGSRRALEWCREHAPRLDAEVLAVHVYSVPVFAYAAYELPTAVVQSDEWKEAARRQLEEEWVQPLGDVGHRTVLVEGAAARALLDVARDEGASMIVVGSRGHGGFTELLLGSVSHHLSHHSPIPLVIVPPPGD